MTRKPFMDANSDNPLEASIARLRSESARRVAAAAETAYMADDYGPAAFERIAAFLLSRGHTEHEAEAILFSKHPRWADDSEGRGNGHTRPNAAAFKRYYLKMNDYHGEGWWKREGAQMAAETPSNLPEDRCEKCGSEDLCWGVDEHDNEDGTYFCEDCGHEGRKEGN